MAYPNAIQACLSAQASLARFDTFGRFLGVGRADGVATIWDLDTKSIVRELDGHVDALTSVDWSRNSRYFLSSSRDWNIIVWDLASAFDPPQRHATIRFDAVVLSARFHPRNSQIMLALIRGGELYLVDRRKNRQEKITLYEPEGNEDDEITKKPMTVACFDPTGKFIFVGTSGGYILVFNTRTKGLIARHRISGGCAPITTLDFMKSGRRASQLLGFTEVSKPSVSRLITISSDRIIRQFIVPHYMPSNDPLEQDLDPTHLLYDPIDKTAWHRVSYSRDGEWLAGGSADKTHHKVYIWDLTKNGELAEVLDGGTEPLVDLQWSPSKASLVSTTDQGTVLIWHRPRAQRWGDLVGGVEEIDETEQYEEREDEFDIVEEEEVFRRTREAQQEDVDVDTIEGLNVDDADGKVAYDEDIEWADKDPDDDDVGNWTHSYPLWDDDA